MKKFLRFFPQSQKLMRRDFPTFVALLSSLLMVEGCATSGQWREYTTMGGLKVKEKTVYVEGSEFHGFMIYRIEGNVHRLYDMTGRLVYERVNGKWLTPDQKKVVIYSIRDTTYPSQEVDWGGTSFPKDEYVANVYVAGELRWKGARVVVTSWQGKERMDVYDKKGRKVLYRDYDGKWYFVVNGVPVKVGEGVSIRVELSVGKEEKKEKQDNR